jgi:hypothetical protein
MPCWWAWAGAVCAGAGVDWARAVPAAKVSVVLVAIKSGFVSYVYRLRLASSIEASELPGSERRSDGRRAKYRLSH